LELLVIDDHTRPRELTKRFDGTAGVLRGLWSIAVFHELRERVVAANLELVRAGLVRQTFGNASAADRDAGVMAIKPSGVSYDALDVDAIPVLEIESGRLVTGAQRPSSDTHDASGLFIAPSGR